MTLSPEVITAILGFAGAFLVKEAWDHIKKRKDSEASFMNASLDKNTEAITELKLALVELKVRIDVLTEKLAPLPKLAQDVNEAHAKIRVLGSKVEAQSNVSES